MVTLFEIMYDGLSSMASGADQASESTCEDRLTRRREGVAGNQEDEPSFSCGCDSVSDDDDRRAAGGLCAERSLSARKPRPYLCGSGSNYRWLGRARRGSAYIA